jgi:hypothetical protein
MPPHSGASGRRSRLAPKPITGFGHSLSEEDTAAAGQAPADEVAATIPPRQEAEPAGQPSDAAPARESRPAAPLRSVRTNAARPPAAAQRGSLDARALVRAARTSARDRPREWETFTARLPAGLANRLNLRVAQDKGAAGDYGLAAAHYLNAALSQIPRDIGQAAQWGLDWRARSTDARTLTRGSGSRLHRDVASAMHELGSWLPTLDVHPRMWEIMAEALTRLLDALDDTPDTTERPH